MSDEKRSYQWLSVFISSLSFTIIGIYISWIGPSVKILNTNGVFISDTHAQWLSDIILLGILPSTFISSYLANRFGRQSTLMFTLFPNAMASLLMMFTEKNLLILYLMRIICGIVVGVTQIVVPIYVAEISSFQIRGSNETFLLIMLLVGTFLGTVVMPLMRFKFSGIITLIISIIHGFGTAFISDTPHYYISIDKEKKAQESLHRLRGTKNISKELTEIKNAWDLQKENISFYQSHKKIIPIFALIMCSQLSPGIPVVYFRISMPKTSTVGSFLLICLYLFSAIVATIFIDKWGRRILFLISSFGNAGSEILIGIYYIYEYIYGVKVMSTFSAILHIFAPVYIIFSTGILIILPNIFVSELFDTKNRTKATCVMKMTFSITGICMYYIWQVCSQHNGLQYFFLFFGLISLSCSIFAYYIIPETKGKSLEEIHTSLRISTSTNVTNDGHTPTNVQFGELPMRSREKVIKIIHI